MSLTKRILSVLMVAVLMFTVAPMDCFDDMEWFAFEASALESEGMCGEDVYWTFDEESGKLTISGEGRMYDFCEIGYEDESSLQMPPYLIDKIIVEDETTTYIQNTIKEVYIEDGVTYIGQNAFAGCYDLQSVVISDSVLEIGVQAFYDCRILEKLELGSGITRIGENAFAWAGCLKEVSIPDSVLIIDSGAFSSCSELTTIEIGSETCFINIEAFLGNEKLENITVSEENSYYTDLDGVLFNKAVTEILFFPIAKQSEEYVIPDGVVSIGEYAFCKCVNLLSIEIPESVIRIGMNAFVDCGYYNDVDNWQDGVLYIDNCLIETGTVSDILKISEGTRVIADYAVSNAESVTKVILNKELVYVGKNSFEGCWSLEEIYMPDSVSVIDDYAFNDCNLLSDVFYYGDDEAWDKISLGSNNGCLSDARLHYNYVPCEHMDITEYAETPATCLNHGYTAGIYCNDCELWVQGHEKIVAGHTDSDSDKICDVCNSSTDILYDFFDNEVIITGYTGDGNSITIPAEIDGYVITKIGNGAFNGCETLKEVVIGSGIEYIESYAFAHCTNLESIEIPGSIKSIESYAFQDCYSLTTVEIPDSVTEIDSGAFENCTSLKNIIIPDSVAVIGLVAFNNTAYYKDENNWENGLLYIGNHLLYGDKDIVSENISIKEGTKVIADGALFWCENICEIVLPESITCIGYENFYLCEGLKDIYYSGDEADWDSINIRWSNPRLSYATIHFGTSEETETTDSFTTESDETTNDIPPVTADPIAPTDPVGSITTDKAEETSSEKEETTAKAPVPTQATTTQPATLAPTTTKKQEQTTEKATKPAKAKIKKPKSAKAKQITVIWNAVKNANGYQVAYSTSKKFTKKTTKTLLVKKAKATKTTLKKLKSGKKYFIKVRAYKTVNKKKVYGAYSKVMSVKVK